MFLLYGLVILGAGETVIGYYLSNHLDWFPFGLTERQQLDYAPRWLGTYESPDHYACFLVMAIGAALALGSFSKLAWPVRIILFYLSFMMIVGVMYSGSRGSWVALLASITALVIMGIRNGTMRWWVPVTGGVLLIAVVGVLFSVSAVARERVMGPQYSRTAVQLDTGVRFQLTVDALRIARNHPFFGTGPGTFAFKHLPYQAGPLTLKSELTRDDYLNCLADYGLVGFGIALFFVVAVTLKFFRPLWIDSRWQDRVVVATGFAAWMALLVHSVVDSNLHIPANALLLFSLTGLAVGRFREEKQPHWSSLSLAPWGRWLGAVIVFVSLLYGSQVAWTVLNKPEIDLRASL
jgi:O-antigen ligase